MKKLLLFIIFLFSPLLTFADGWWESGWSDCDWIELNTNVPYVWNCIEREESDEAFPRLMWWVSRIVITLTLVVAFLMLVAWWVLITMSWADQSSYWKWKELIIKVIVWILLLWASWVILYMINPNFFS